MPPTRSPRFSTLADCEEIRRAIREHRLVEFYYTGELVTVEPYIHGLGPRYSSPILLAWSAEQGWREYSLMRIRRFRVLDRCYEQSRADYDPQDPRMRMVDTAAAPIARTQQAG
jgi:predicted DNA-binding transcriptional regulator YafY